MIRFALRRLAAAVPVVLGVLTLTFVLVEATPGGATDALLGDRPVPPEIRRRIEAAYGLDRPASERYLRWLEALMLRGELGWSFSRSRPVTRLVADALPATLPLAGAALAMHLLVGIGIGVVSASARGRWPDRLITAASLVVYSTPLFWLGLMAVLALSLAAPIFPPAGMRSPGSEAWPLLSRGVDFLWHLSLPAAVLGIGSAASLGRFVRAGVLESLGNDFVRAARARGAGTRRVLVAHGLRNALLPVLTLAGLSLPVLVSGSLVVEVVFAWPGMGRLAYEAILARDVPVVLACTLLTTLMVVIGSLLADLALGAADPRVRTGRGPR